MEEVIQITIFIAVTAIVMINKYKEGQVDRPKKVMRPASHSTVSGDDEFSEEDYVFEEDSNGDFSFEKFDDFEEEPDNKIFSNKIPDEVTAEEKRFTINRDYATDFKDSPIKEEVSDDFTAQNVSLSSPRQQKKEPLIHLKSRKEARKAFIYSEIFNRRYE